MPDCQLSKAHALRAPVERASHAPRRAPLSGTAPGSGLELPGACHVGDVPELHARERLDLEADVFCAGCEVWSSALLLLLFLLLLCCSGSLCAI